MAAQAFPPTAWKEADRLAALREYRILDTPPEAAFSGIVNLAAHVCGTPIALVSFVERTRQWFKAETGLGVVETPVEQSVCAHAIRQNGLFVVPDATRDARFVHNPLVTGEPHIRFYAGAPLETPRGFPLGTLCVIDRQPRLEGLSAEQAEMLVTLARLVVTQLEHRLALMRLAEPGRRARDTLALVRSIARCSSRTAGTAEDLAARIEGRVDALARVLEVGGRDAAGGVDLASLVAEELLSFAASEGEQVSIEGPDLRLPAAAAGTLALALHELAANAIEHGALTSPDGHVAVSWTVMAGEAGPRLALEWVERGVELEEGAPRRSGFGTEVLERMLARGLQARTGLAFLSDGVRCTIELPLGEGAVIGSA